MRRQRGLLLLPVSIALAIMGALAYSMTRQAAAGVAAIDAQHETEAMRYLAEAGVRLAKWQNEKIGCGSSLRLSAARLPGVPGSVSVDNIVSDHEKFTVTVTATSERGTVSSLTRDKMMYFDRTRLYSLTTPASEIRDTSINSATGNSAQGGSAYLEASDGKSHILVNMSLNSVPARARVMKATLSLYQYDAKSVQPGSKLAVHALTRSWSDGSALWDAPWTGTPGGSYETSAVASADIGPNQRYAWEIAPLIRRWDSGALPNYGVLFKPSGLADARFHSMNAASELPKLVLDYHKRCD